MVSVLSKASKKIDGQNNTAFNGNQTQDLVIASHSLNRCATVQSLHLSQQLYNMAHKTAQSCITRLEIDSLKRLSYYLPLKLEARKFSARSISSVDCWAIFFNNGPLFLESSFRRSNKLNFFARHSNND